VARKSAPVAETPPEEVVSAPEPTPEPAPEPAPAAAPALPEPVTPTVAVPVRTYKAPRPEPTRCGGWVLTERGWEIDQQKEG